MKWLVLCRLGLSVAAAQPTVPAFRTGASEVVVDLVVRDRKGNLVRNLEANALTLEENGIGQQIQSFRIVRGRPEEGAISEPAFQQSSVSPAAGGPTTLQVYRPIRLVSLVYQSLGSEARRVARQASFAFLDRDYGPNVYYAVFLLGRDLVPVVAYSNDRARVRQGIEWATRAVGESAVPPDGLFAPQTHDASQNQMVSMTLAMKEFNERMDRQMFAQVALFGMAGMIEELGRLPGRKTVLLFSQGLELPNGQWQQYYGLINAANRANITIHTVAAQGLTVQSPQAAANRYLDTAMQGMINASGGTGVELLPRETNQAGSNTNFSTGYGRAELKMDYAMDALRGNSVANLEDLASRTGGIAMVNANDFRNQLRALSDEFNTYFELTYHPTDGNYDGRFRKIVVKSSRPGDVVQAREGYFALPALPGQIVFPYEVQLLSALARPPAPKELNFRSALLQYRFVAGHRQAQLIFDLSLGHIGFTPDKDSGQQRTHFSVLALVKDSEGQVVSKLSRDVPMLTPPDKIGLLQQGRFVVTWGIRLQPGRYTLESAVMDHEGGKVATRKVVQIVRGDRPGPDISDFAVVRRTDNPSESPDPEDAFRAGTVRIVPTLVESFSRDRAIPVYLRLYPESGQPGELKLILDVVREGKVVQRQTPALPESAGREIPMMAQIPIAALETGQYEFRASLVQGDKVVQRSWYGAVE